MATQALEEWEDNDPLSRCINIMTRSMRPWVAGALRDAGVDGFLRAGDDDFSGLLRTVKRHWSDVFRNKCDAAAQSLLEPAIVNRNAWAHQRIRPADVPHVLDSFLQLADALHMPGADRLRARMKPSEAGAAPHAPYRDTRASATRMAAAAALERQRRAEDAEDAAASSSRDVQERAFAAPAMHDVIDLTNDVAIDLTVEDDDDDVAPVPARSRKRARMDAAPATPVTASAAPVTFTSSSSISAAATAAASWPSSSAASASNTLRVVSYNVDGLEAAYLLQRAEAIVKLLETMRPPADIIMLQEVTPDNDSVFEAFAHRQGYTLFSAQDATTPYYCVAMLRDARCASLDAFVQSHRVTGMGRHMITVQATVGDAKVTAITSHLESMKASSGVRKLQLRDSLTALAGSDAELAFLVGDLNLRDEEADAVLRDSPLAVFKDAWVTCGRPREAQYTWDLQVNDNKSIPGRAPVRCRFDRLYFAGRGHPTWKATSFTLLGTARLPAAAGNMFPSDHFGIVVDFEKR